MISTLTARTGTTTDVTRRRPARRRLTAGLLVAGAAALNGAFLALGTAFDYPQVLNKEPGEVLATFHADQLAIGGWFLLLALGAGLIAPISVLVGRLGTSAALRAAVPVGIAAATVQVIGLLRWPLLVPGLAAQATDPAAQHTFDTLNLLLGTVIGETIGYALTATWTVLVAVGLHRSRSGRPLLGRPMMIVGLAAAVMIAAGTVEPLGVPVSGLLNFAGYIIWSAWLVGTAVVLLRTPSDFVDEIEAS